MCTATLHKPALVVRLSEALLAAIKQILIVTNSIRFSVILIPDQHKL